MNTRCTAVLFLVVLVMSACGGGGGSSTSSSSSSSSDIKLQSLTVTAKSQSMTLATAPASSTQQLTATGNYSDGSKKDLTSTVAWTSSSQTVATVNSGGMVTAVASGNATISASYEGASSSVQISIIAQLTGISVTPSTADLLLPISGSASTQQFRATGIYNDGKQQDITTQVHWSSSNATVASITSSGLAEALTSGSANIEATVGSVSGSAVLTVTAQLVSIAVAPGNLTIPLVTAPNPPTTEQFTATGNYNDGTAKDLTSQVQWSSSNTSVAAINASGLATALANGSTIIQAAYGSRTGTTMLNVQHQLVSVTVSSPLSTMAPGTKQQFTATATYNDNTTADVTTTAAWSSSDDTVAVVSNTTPDIGIVTAVAQGTATIKATLATALGAGSGTFVLTVSNAKIVSLSIDPGSAAFGIGLTQHFVANARFDDGSSQDISNVATWSSIAPPIALSTGGGYFFGKGLGTAGIVAFWQGVSSTSFATVDTSSVLSLAISPSSAQIAHDTTQSFRALATLANGSTTDLSTVVGMTWSSSSTSVATVSNSGLAFGVAASPSPVNIIATLGTMAPATSPLTVTSANATAVAVAPPNFTMQVGSSRTYAAMGIFDDGTTQNISSLAHWTSSDTGVATMAGSTARAIAPGTSNIQASFETASGSAPLVCSSGAVVTSISLAPATLQLNTLSPAKTARLTVTATYSDNSKQTINSGVTYTTSDVNVASVSTNGVVTAVAAGSATITASLGANVANATVTVTSSPLVSLQLTPMSPRIAAATGQQFAATGTFQDSSTQVLTSYVHWSSSQPSVATVGSGGAGAGFALSSTAGSSQIRSDYNGVVSQPANLTVSSATVQSITISPANATIPLGTVQSFRAMALFSDSTMQDVTSLATWSSSAAKVIFFNSGATGTTSGTGTATVSASFDGMVGQTSVTVQ